ncbi:MAG: hypothetical protein K2W96_24425 [Gemmataceae bacterium]|nr:hypothetical protein [Gemmataceae bacterium]
MSRFLLAGLLLVPAAVADQIVPIKGDPIKGSIVGASDAEAVIDVAGKKAGKAVKDILRLDFRAVGKPAGEFAVIELADGTAVRAAGYLIKKRTVEIELLSGPSVKVPLDTVSGILNKGGSESARREWKTRAVNSPGRDVMVIDFKGIVSGAPVKLGNGTPDGKAIESDAGAGISRAVEQ